MYKINDNYQKLPGSYLFSTIGKKVSAYVKDHPDQEVIRLGIGDVTQPLAPSIIGAMHRAVDEMGCAETFHGYAPELGYEFLREAIVKGDYEARGCHIRADEIFVSDGAKCDCSNIQELFHVDNVVAVCDPVYPVYVDTNAMAGRAGDYDGEKWTELVYLLNCYYTLKELAAFYSPIYRYSKSFRYFVMQNYMKAKDVEAFAQMGGYSTPTFRRLFKETFGEPAYQWMLKKKCEDIQNDLTTTEMSISEISYKYGFESLSNFSHFCRTNFGMSPRALRNKKDE